MKVGTGNYLFRVSGEEVDSWVIAYGYEIGTQLEDDALTYYSVRYTSLDEAKESLTDDVPDSYKIYGVDINDIIVVEVTE